ncbi:hypothetical protein [Geomonas agri]|uniref:hypothetical protein n=1 Tax=Geomonas agri TaxID=2873702 RepID=UPI001CD1BBB1|nr:hypothetical protein [Geomonas agri]
MKKDLQGDAPVGFSTPWYHHISEHLKTVLKCPVKALRSRQGNSRYPGTAGDSR